LVVANFENIVELLHHEDHRVRALSATLVFKAMTESTHEQYVRLQDLCLRHASIIFLFERALREGVSQEDRETSVRLLTAMTAEHEASLSVTRRMLDYNETMINHWAGFTEGAFAVEYHQLENANKLSKNEKKIADLHVKHRVMKRLSWAALIDKLTKIPTCAIQGVPDGVYVSATIRWSVSALAELRSVLRALQKHYLKFNCSWNPCEFHVRYESLYNEAWPPRVYSNLYNADVIARTDVSLPTILPKVEIARSVFLSLMSSLILTESDSHAAIYVQSMLNIAKEWAIDALLFRSELPSFYRSVRCALVRRPTFVHVLKSLLLHPTASVDAHQVFLECEGAQQLVALLTHPAVTVPLAADALVILHHLSGFVFFARFLTAPRMLAPLCHGLAQSGQVSAMASPEVQTHFIQLLSASFAVDGGFLTDDAALFVLLHIAAFVFPVCVTEALGAILERSLKQSLHFLFPAPTLAYLDKNGSRKFAAMLQDGTSDPTVLFTVETRENISEYARSILSRLSSCGDSSFADDSSGSPKSAAISDDLKLVDRLFFAGPGVQSLLENRKVQALFNAVANMVASEKIAFPDLENALRIGDIYVGALLNVFDSFRLENVNGFLEACWHYLDSIEDEIANAQNIEMVNKLQARIYADSRYEDKISHPYRHMSYLFDHLSQPMADQVLLSVVKSAEENVDAINDEFVLRLVDGCINAPGHGSPYVFMAVLATVMARRPISFIDNDEFYLSLVAAYEDCDGARRILSTVAESCPESAVVFEKLGVSYRILKHALEQKSTESCATVDHLLAWKAPESQYLAALVPYGCENVLDASNLPVEEPRILWTQSMHTKCLSRIERVVANSADRDDSSDLYDELHAYDYVCGYFLQHIKRPDDVPAEKYEFLNGLLQHLESKHSSFDLVYSVLSALYPSYCDVFVSENDPVRKLLSITQTILAEKNYQLEGESLLQFAGTASEGTFFLYNAISMYVMVAFMSKQLSDTEELLWNTLRDIFAGHSDWLAASDADGKNGLRQLAVYACLRTLLVLCGNPDVHASIQRTVAEVLHTVATSSEHGSEAMVQLLCGPHLERILNSGNSAGFVEAFWDDHETPFLIWNAETRKYLADHVCADSPLEQYEQPLIKQELVVGGIFVRVFLSSRFVNMRNPAAFVESLVHFVHSHYTDADVKSVSNLRLVWDALVVAIKTFTFSDDSADETIVPVLKFVPEYVVSHGVDEHMRKLLEALVVRAPRMFAYVMLKSQGGAVLENIVKILYSSNSSGGSDESTVTSAAKILVEVVSKEPALAAGFFKQHVCQRYQLLVMLLSADFLGHAIRLEIAETVSRLFIQSDDQSFRGRILYLLDRKFADQFEKNPEKLLAWIDADTHTVDDDGFIRSWSREVQSNLVSCLQRHIASGEELTDSVEQSIVGEIHPQPQKEVEPQELPEEKSPESPPVSQSLDTPHEVPAEEAN
jgi:hypothetical protein